MLTLYGLKSCDTCRKVRRSAENAGKTIRLVDVRETPLDAATLNRFLSAFGDKLVNKSSTTWRNLDEIDRTREPLDLLLAHPTLMKRPVIEGETLTLGWSADIEKAHLG